MAEKVSEASSARQPASGLACLGVRSSSRLIASACRDDPPCKARTSDAIGPSRQGVRRAAAAASLGSGVTASAGGASADGTCPVIRFPDDQAELTGFGHQWESTL